ncbi:pentapeptide repeat-containing protein [Curtobacterium citreum]|uniref:pentapeptide repeat-containing protein n=1 Tax=Curtobacterium citreum TaxID=2036 RepID=UPI001585CCD0
MTATTSPHADPVDSRAALRPDCRSCTALCCTLLGFVRSADFPVEKPAGEPCTNLRPDAMCRIHDRLRARGFRGCTVFECFGAGQRVTADRHEDVGAAFAAVRRLHEARWYLAEVDDRSWDQDLLDRSADLQRRIEPLVQRADASPEDILSEVRSLLYDVSDEVRARSTAAADWIPSEVPGVDLAGRDLRGRDAVGALFRNAMLIAADLRGVDLTHADLLGADLRDARLGGADLSAALFLTQPQVNAADGDGSTVLPPWLDRPAHWTAG